jgi:hypothetical protein
VVVSIFAYGTPRFRVPAEVPLVVLAAVALTALFESRRGAAKAFA